MYTRPTVGVEPRAAGDRVVVVAWGLIPGTTSPADGPGLRDLVTAVSNDGGSTFSTPVIASGPGEQLREPSQPVVGPDHAIYVAWTSRTGGIGTNIVVAESADGGATWVRNLAGAVTGKGQGPNGGEAEIAIDHSTGSLYVVYQEQTPYGDQDVWFQKSTDGATTWSKPLRVNDDPTGNGIRQHVPRIAVASNGRIDVVWLDHRNGYVAPVLPAPRGEADVYYASSSDGGATFSANRRITDHTINLDMGLGPYLGSYSWYGPALAELGNNGVFFAWSDPRSGNVDNNSNDIYTATLHLSGAGDQSNVNELTTADSVSLAVQLSQQAYPGGGEKISGAFIANRVVLVNQNDAASATPSWARSWPAPTTGRCFSHRLGRSPRVSRTKSAASIPAECSWSVMTARSRPPWLMSSERSFRRTSPGSGRRTASPPQWGWRRRWTCAARRTRPPASPPSRAQSS